MNTAIVKSPVGDLYIASEDGALIACEFEDYERGMAHNAHKEKKGGKDAVLDQARRELDQFFAGTLKRFTIPVAPRGTEFQRKVWRALQAIPYGRTTSYGQIAAKVGLPQAMRAVGAANGRNPICIIIPCHRVIGADGSLTGFGGGLDRKRFLLGLERGEAPLL
ncbi:MAG: methylated-DNA--[protein]-cysteine S-methyltransferase [Hyphomonadaceae bacterium]